MFVIECLHLSPVIFTCKTQLCHVQHSCMMILSNSTVKIQASLPCCQVSTEKPAIKQIEIFYVLCISFIFVFWESIIYLFLTFDVLMECISIHMVELNLTSNLWSYYTKTLTPFRLENISVVICLEDYSFLLFFFFSI